MTPEQIDAMEAGREMNALVAEKVMEWTTYEEYVHGPLMHGGAMRLLYKGEGATKGRRTWHVDGFKPSEDIAAAWPVAEKLGLTVFSWGNAWIAGELSDESYVEPHVDGSKSLVIDGHINCYAEADTAPLAICRAALKAVNPVTNEPKGVS